MKKEINCYECKHRGEIQGDAHSICQKYYANVKGNEYGKKSGWFNWPFNFDPTWLEECDSFEKKD